MIFGFGDFEFDDERLILSRLGHIVRMERIAAKLLAFLLHNAGKVVSRAQIVDEVWQRRALERSSVTAAVTKLRKILRSGNEQNEYIETLYGSGYRFVGALTMRRLPTNAAVTPFVGRVRMLSRLEGAVAEAWRGNGRVCALMGAPGIGKTRMIEALEQQVAKSSVRVAWASCQHLGESPLALWRWLVCSVTESAELSLRYPDGPPLPGMLDLLDGGEPLERRVLRTDRLRRQESFELFMRAVARSSSKTPRVLVIEDLHRADAASLELLAHVTEEIAHFRLLIVATLPITRSMSAPRPETPLPYLLGHRNCDRVFLEQLGEEEVEAYLDAMSQQADRTTRQKIYTESAGNPRVMKDLVHRFFESFQAQRASDGAEVVQRGRGGSPRASHVITARSVREAARDVMSFSPLPLSVHSETR